MLQLQFPINANGEVFEYLLEEPLVSVGRRHDNDIRIKETYISAYHAQFTLGEDGEYYLEDRDSSNGTYHNGERLSGKVRVGLGDTLRFGSLKCYVAEATPSIVMEGGETGIAKREGLRPDQKSSLVTATRNVFYAIDRQKAGEASRVGEVGGFGSREHRKKPDGLEEFQEKLLLLEEEHRELKEHLAQAEEQLKKSREELEAKTGELAKERNLVKELKKEHRDALSQVEGKLRARESETNKLARKLRAAITEIDELRNQLKYGDDDSIARLHQITEQLSEAKDDNVLLQESLETLTQERDKLREQCLELVQKLRRTREGFSFFLNKARERLRGTDSRNAEIVAEHGETVRRLKTTNAELETLRLAVEQMKQEHREKLETEVSARTEAERRAEEVSRELESVQISAKDDAHRVTQDFQKKLATEKKGREKAARSAERLQAMVDETRHEVEVHQARVRELDETLRHLRKEKAASEETLEKKNRELEESNRKLLGLTRDLNEYEAQVAEAAAQAEQLREEKEGLREETEKLGDEKDELIREITRLTEDHLDLSGSLERDREESDRVAEKLNELVSRLKDSERKVVHLRELENSLERSVVRAHRSALSRRGIYSENGKEPTEIWPETEVMICRELIEKMELLEDLLKAYQQRRFFPKFAEQLNLLQESFMALLRNHSVDQFNLEPGTELSVESRKKIQLISVDDLEDPRIRKLSAQKKGRDRKTTVLETLRPGYIYRNGGKDVIIRKAEVVVA